MRAGGKFDTRGQGEEMPWKKSYRGKKKGDGNNEATFSFLFSFFLPPPFSLFCLLSEYSSVSSQSREENRKLSFKFLSVEVERVLLRVLYVRVREEGGGTNIKTNEYKIFDFARCWRNYFSKKERNEFFTVIGSIVELSIDVSIFFFFFFGWKTNFSFVMAATI